MTYPENVFAWTMPKEVLNQLVKHFLNLTEIILPYSLHINAFPWVKMFFIFTCIITLLFSIYQTKGIHHNHDKAITLANFFLTIGISYYGFLSLASIYAGFSWGDLYRVSGFGILFMLNSFWIYVYVYAPNWKKYILIAMMFSSITKLGYGVRYEIINQKNRFLFQDYRDSITNIVSDLDKNCGGIFVHIGNSWEATNLFLMLKYYNINYFFPFKILEYSKQQERTGSILLCTKMDLPYFKNYKFDFTEINKQKVFAHQFHSQ
jgi:hypothetical protein